VGQMDTASLQGTVTTAGSVGAELTAAITGVTNANDGDQIEISVGGSAVGTITLEENDDAAAIAGKINALNVDGLSADVDADDNLVITSSLAAADATGSNATDASISLADVDSGTGLA